jgi:hypothetical protein
VGKTVNKSPEDTLRAVLTMVRDEATLVGKGVP